MAAPTLHQSKVASSPDASGDEGLHLTVMGPSVFETYPLPASGRITIGREDDADVRIVDELASRLHARIHIDASGKVSVEDLDSSNGTFVRGERIELRGFDHRIAGTPERVVPPIVGEQEEDVHPIRGARKRGHKEDKEKDTESARKHGLLGGCGWGFRFDGSPALQPARDQRAQQRP